MVDSAVGRVHDSWPSVLATVRIRRCTSPSRRESPERLCSFVACLLNREADVCEEMVFSISQFAELTSLAAAFDPDLDRPQQLREKERDRPRAPRDRYQGVASGGIG
jgi:hypothetical protein